MRTEPSKPGVHTEVGVRQLREELSAWLEEVKAGGRVTITERGRPIARIVPLSGPSSLEELIAQGRVTPALRPARKRTRADLIKLSGGPISDLLRDERG